MSARKPVVALNITDEKEFEKECKKLIDNGYTISSTYCGFINSESYGFCASYQAIFVDQL
ncbi:MAG: hypothetical protein KAT04_14470 [Methylococcales bacterium]|nr:hypothetical protein [Methylococcales bacterium]